MCGVPVANRVDCEISFDRRGVVEVFALLGRLIEYFRALSVPMHVDLFMQALCCAL